MLTEEPAIEMAQENDPDLAYYLTAAHLAFDFSAIEGIRAKVVATLNYQLDPKLGSIGAPLMLYGQDLDLGPIKLNGVPLKTTEYMANSDSSRLSLPSNDATGVVEITTYISYTDNEEDNGLYSEQDSIIAQCNNNGIERITYFPRCSDSLLKISITTYSLPAKFNYMLSTGSEITVKTNQQNIIVAESHDQKPKPISDLIIVLSNLVKVELAHTCSISKKTYNLRLDCTLGFQGYGNMILSILDQVINWHEQTSQTELEDFQIVVLPLRHKISQATKFLSAVDQDSLFEVPPLDFDINDNSYVANFIRIAKYYFARQLNPVAINQQLNTLLLAMSGYPKYAIHSLKQIRNSTRLSHLPEIIIDHSAQMQLWLSVQQEFYALVSKWYKDKPHFLEFPYSLTLRLKEIMLDKTIAPGFKADILEIPRLSNFYHKCKIIDSGFLKSCHQFLQDHISSTLENEWFVLYLSLHLKYDTNDDYSFAAIGIRQLRALCAQNLASTHNPNYIQYFQVQALAAENAQDILSAEKALSQYTNFKVVKDGISDETSDSDSDSRQSLCFLAADTPSPEAPFFTPSFVHHKQTKDKRLEAIRKEVSDWWPSSSKTGRASLSR